MRRTLSATDEVAALDPGITLIDSHCHLDVDEFDADREAVLARAATAGVDAFVTIGASGSLQANWQALALAQTHTQIFATVGVHPHEARLVTDEVVASLEALADDPRVVAIGETGLDFHYDNSPRVAQENAFRRFIDVARRTGRPVVVHLRAADDAAVAILREERAQEVGGVIHCFSSDERAARAFLDLGFHLSFSGIVTFKNADAIRRAAVLTPADRLMVETDAPFLAPAPYRGRRNEPALMVRTAAVLAELRRQPMSQLATDTRTNTRRLFRLA